MGKFSAKTKMQPFTLSYLNEPLCSVSIEKNLAPIFNHICISYLQKLNLVCTLALGHASVLIELCLIRIIFSAIAGVYEGRCVSVCQ